MQRRMSEADQFQRVMALLDSPEFSREIVVHEATFPRQGLYFIFGAGLIKIGLAGCVVERLACLRNGSPSPLEPLGFIRCADWKLLAGFERDMHQRFAALRSHGEWFRDDPLLRDFIAASTQAWPTR